MKIEEKINKFFIKNNVQNTNIIISIDLDNTLIIRKKGSNYINKELKKILINLHHKKVIVIPNTGRDIIGFKSFQKSINYKNAVLYSGGLLLHKNKKILNKKSVIEKEIIKKFINATKNNTLPFIDVYKNDGRILLYNKKSQCYKNLFFTQTPTDWFLGKLPIQKDVNKINCAMLKNVMRIEFPIFNIPGKKILFKKIKNKIPCENDLQNIIKINKNYLKNYSIKKKAFFNKEYSTENILFARFEKSNKIINKGIGLKKILEKMQLDNKKIILHIGDKDSGLINDTLVKKEIPAVKIIMIGNNYDQKNQNIDLCLGKNTEKSLLLFFKILNKYTSYDKK